MTATNFNTKNDTYRKLMGNGLTYRIPRFQRDYSWGEDEWDDLWQDILGTITTLVPLAEHLPQRRIRASEHSLRKAFEWFDRRIRDYVKATPSADIGMTIAQLIESMSDKLFFTVITVTDELNAYKVFETLNARGVRLSATDLLKNYLFSVLHRRHQEHEHELKNLEDRWENMVGRLGSESFPIPSLKPCCGRV